MSPQLHYTSPVAQTLQPKYNTPTNPMTLHIHPVTCSYTVLAQIPASPRSWSRWKRQAIKCYHNWNLMLTFGVCNLNPVSRRHRTSKRKAWRTMAEFTSVTCHQNVLTAGNILGHFSYLFILLILYVVLPRLCVKWSNIHAVDERKS